MREVRKWHDEYRGVPFEIQNFALSDISQWTFYLFIREPQFSKKIFERFWLSPKSKVRGRIYYAEYQEPLISDIEWHGGCTFYQKLGGHDGTNRAVQIGCDYGHMFDDGINYNVLDVHKEVKIAIDSLYKLVPNIRHRCWVCGRWGIRDYVYKKDRFMCKKCNDKQNKEET